MALFGNKKTADSKKPAAAKTAKSEAAKPAVSMQDLYAETGRAVKTTAVKTAGTATTTAINLSSVIVKPVITEKATNLVAANKYAFVVTTGANKISVAKAINSLYGVKPVAVNIINRRGKKVSRGQIKGKRSASKMAIVTLQKGEAIKIYEGV